MQNLQQIFKRKSARILVAVIVNVKKQHYKNCYVYGSYFLSLFNSFYNGEKINPNFKFRKRFEMVILNVV